MLICVCVLSLVVYGILTPIYGSIFRGKLSNEKGFYAAWLTAPFLVAYFYSYPQHELLLPLLIILNIIGYYLVVTNRFNYLTLLFFITAILGQLIYSLFYS